MSLHTPDKGQHAEGQHHSWEGFLMSTHQKHELAHTG